ncbi:hypothetical protein FLX08_06510 [Microbispora hainanensis]|uniref:Uncharacterized protein n=1 Tax=Microbispora hainanensis TaxID=568844 RepID=A0A544Z1P8_9ACTN|nr:hypothetical protein FLX08_06510 [Microbispora hainanensis]
MPAVVSSVIATPSGASVVDRYGRRASARGLRASLPVAAGSVPGGSVPGGSVSGSVPGGSVSGSVPGGFVSGSVSGSVSGRVPPGRSAHMPPYPLGPDQTGPSRREAPAARGARVYAAYPRRLGVHGQPFALYACAS